MKKSMEQINQIDFGFVDGYIQGKRNYFEQVKEELAVYGMDSVGVKELLAIIMGSKADSNTCHELALLPLVRLLAMTTKELQQLGMAPNVATRLEATFQLFRKLKTDPVLNNKRVDNPSDAAEALAFIGGEEQEHLAVLLLDTKNNIKKTVVVSKGTINSSLVHPREVFKPAIRESAHSIVIGHNHPSGNPTPSREDIEVTKRISKAGEHLGIELLDHIIVCPKGYKSLKEMGLF